jgi:hypothetical protein
VDIDVVESDPYVIYAASATGGLFKTTDNGVTGGGESGLDRPLDLH